MDVFDELPEVEPVLPEPDFFDAEDLGGAVAVSNIPVAPPTTSAPTVMSLGLSPPEKPWESSLGVDVEIKYDDEACNFDEFLIGVPKLDQLAETTEQQKEKESEEEMQSCNEDETERESQTTELDADAVESDRKDGISNGSVRSFGSGSGPSTPDYKPGQVIRLSLPALPKVSIGSNKKISIPRNSPRRDGSNVSPPRQIRGRLNASPISTSTAGKRKLSESEEENDESSILNKSSTTRSGRQTRKIARFGHDGNGGSDISDKGKDSPEKSKSRNKSSARVGRYGDNRKDVEDPEVLFDSDSDSDIFSVVKVSKKIPNYRTADNGLTYYTDRVGNEIIIRPVTVKLKRLTKGDIAEIIQGFARDAALKAVLLEVCIDNFRSAQEAVTGGAKRIELCSSLHEGGLTPSSGFLTLVKERYPDTPVFVMIRPRGGDFVYTAEEIEIMKRDIEHLKDKGADGFVFGVLTKDCEVDVEACQQLVHAAYPSNCTFHRAFDKVDDPTPALETVITLGFTRILTSGLRATAKEGIATLKRLVEAAGDRIIIMAGAGVNEKNVSEIIKKTGVGEVHGSASKSVSTMVADTPPPLKRGSKGGKGKKRGSKSMVAMGATDDSVIKVTDSALVAQIVKYARR